MSDDITYPGFRAGSFDLLLNRLRGHPLWLNGHPMFSYGKGALIMLVTVAGLPGTAFGQPKPKAATTNITTTAPLPHGLTRLLPHHHVAGRAAEARVGANPFANHRIRGIAAKTLAQFQLLPPEFLKAYDVAFGQALHGKQDAIGRAQAHVQGMLSGQQAVPDFNLKQFVQGPMKQAVIFGLGHDPALLIAHAVLSDAMAGSSPPSSAQISAAFAGVKQLLDRYALTPLIEAHGQPRSQLAVAKIIGQAGGQPLLEICAHESGLEHLMVGGGLTVPALGACQIVNSTFNDSLKRRGEAIKASLQAQGHGSFVPLLDLARQHLQSPGKTTSVQSVFLDSLLHVMRAHPVINAHVAADVMSQAVKRAIELYSSPEGNCGILRAHGFAMDCTNVSTEQVWSVYFSHNAAKALTGADERDGKPILMAEFMTPLELNANRLTDKSTVAEFRQRVFAHFQHARQLAVLRAMQAEETAKRPVALPGSPSAAGLRQ